MPQCVVIADDLTGANATGVLLKQLNYRSLTVFNCNTEAIAQNKNCDCIIYPTDSRSLSANEAYERVREALIKFKHKDVKVYSKRIDSTLRGNLGAETNAMLDVLGDDFIAAVAPAFPSSGRIVIGGFMLVNGTPLHKTDIAIDPKAPVHDSEVTALFQKQSKYPICKITINDMMHGKHQLADKIKALRNEGKRIFCFDCVSQEDLDLIADALITSKINIVAIDPGVFTATYTRKIISPFINTQKAHILTVIGSVNPTTKLQLDYFLLSQRTNHVVVDTALLLESQTDREREIARVTNEIIKNYDRFAVSVVSGDGLNPENRINFPYYQKKLNLTLDEVSGLINNSFGEITVRLLKQVNAFKGLYTSGGDITICVCNKTQSNGIDLIDEVLPLAAYGKLIDGPFKGLHIVTKGGSQGQQNALAVCIDYLKKTLFI